MSARPISSATITFGLVSIPVKLFSAAQNDTGISFNLLHEKCHSRLKQQYICPKDGEIVTRDQMVKGYQFAKDQYVIFTDEELKALDEASSKAIEIAEFVPLDKVDPIYFESAYYLGPDKGGDKPYRLLVEAMKRSGQAAVALHSARGRQTLVLMRTVGDALVMQQLKHADELKPISEIPLPSGDVREPELKLAMQFVEQLSNAEFAPAKYEDTHKKKLEQAIQEKVNGQAISITPAPAPAAQVVDLMEALKASLAQLPQKERKGPRRATRTEAAPAAAPRKKSSRG